MIPIPLQEALESKLKELFTSREFKNPLGGENVALNIYNQSLPKRSKNEISLYPYVIIKLSEGEQVTSTSPDVVKIMFIIGVFDNDNENQGHREVTKIMNRIAENLKKHPLVDREYDLIYPFRWVIHDEDTSPYYFGGIETMWNAATFSREDVEDLI